MLTMHCKLRSLGLLAQDTKKPINGEFDRFLLFSSILLFTIYLLFLYYTKFIKAQKSRNNRKINL
ncbi:hypothetical protein TW85_10270 [Marinomonas sp. S3726]|nr:hypothetical protein TW85_10270 [Marinomonas sp. S3726]